MRLSSDWLANDELGTLSDVWLPEMRLHVWSAYADLSDVRQDLRGMHMPRMKRGARCSSSCLTRDHKTWGECIKAKGLQVSPAINDAYGTRQRAWDRELDSYESAVRQGLEPAGTKQRHVDAAFKEADAL